MPLGQTYAWEFSAPEATLQVRAENTEGETDAKVFEAGLKLSRRELTAGSLLRMMARYPLSTHTTQYRIHKQALSLYNKGAQFFPHPNGTETRASRAIAAVSRLFTGAGEDSEPANAATAAAAAQVCFRDGA